MFKKDSLKGISNIIKENDKNSNQKELYILTDRPVSKLLEYFRDCGLKVSKIYDNVDTIGDELIINSNNIRLLITDTGLGNFTGNTSREKLASILDLADENIEIAMYYTDMFIVDFMKERKLIDNNRIKVYKYKSTKDIVINELKLNNNYIYSEDMETSNNEEDMLNKKEYCSLKMMENTDIKYIELSKIIDGMNDATNVEISRYKVKY